MCSDRQKFRQIKLNYNWNAPQLTPPKKIGVGGGRSFEGSGEIFLLSNIILRNTLEYIC